MVCASSCEAARRLISSEAGSSVERERSGESVAAVRRGQASERKCEVGAEESEERSVALLYVLRGLR